MSARIEGDLYVTGNIGGRTFTPPAGSITNAAVIASAGIDASKLRHRFYPSLTQDQGTAATAQRKIVHTVKGATATLNGMYTTVTAPGTGDRTVTVDLKKNGSSILSATYVIDSSPAAYAEESPLAFTSTALVAGDDLEISYTLGGTTGNYPQGLHTFLSLDEDAA